MRYFPEETITSTLSFCEARAVPKRTCKENEIAVTLRGVGPIIYDIVGEISCRCPEPLVLQKAIPDGPFSLRYYSCGKVSAQYLDIFTFYRIAADKALFFSS